MPKTSRRRSVDPSRLYHDIQLRSRMLRAYYDILNEDTDFAAALLRLYEQAVERLPTQASWRDRPTPPSEIADSFEAFMRRWMLPDEGLCRCPTCGTA